LQPFPCNSSSKITSEISANKSSKITQEISANSLAVNYTLCRKYPDCSIIARNVAKNDQISGQFYNLGNWDNPVKILPGLHHSRYYLILTGLVHHNPVKHVLSVVKTIRDSTLIFAITPKSSFCSLQKFTVRKVLETCSKQSSPKQRVLTMVCCSQTLFPWEEPVAFFADNLAFH
jgi:hypothetical protein